MDKKNFIEQHFGDKGLILILAIFFIFSLLTVFSASSSADFFHGSDMNIISKHFTKYFLAIVFFVLFVFINHQALLKKNRDIILIITSFILTILLFTPLGVTINGATRWIKILGVSFQPLDFTKLSLIIFISNRLGNIQNNEDLMKKYFKIIGAITLTFCFFIGIHDTSGAVLLFIISFLLMIIARIDNKLILRVLVIILILGIILVSIIMFADIDLFRSFTIKNRLLAFLTPEKLPDNHPAIKETGYLKIAIGRAGFLGQGAGNSVIRKMLSNSSSDYIFSIFIEEWGILLGACIVLCYLMIISRCIKTFNELRDIKSALMLLGFALLIVIQAFIHIAVNLGLVPITGIPLPFFSTGGTSLLFTGIMYGSIINIIKSVNNNPQDNETNLEKNNLDLKDENNSKIDAAVNNSETEDNNSKQEIDFNLEDEIEII